MKYRIRKEVVKTLALAHICRIVAKPDKPRGCKVQNYFGKSNRTNSYELYRNILSNDMQTPGGPAPYINNILFTKTDLDGLFTKNAWDPYNYIGSDEEDKLRRSRIFISDFGWGYRDLPYVECCHKLGHKVEQDSMDSLAATILHKIM